MIETPHITALQRQAKLKRMAADCRFRIVNGKAEKYAGELSVQKAEVAVETAIANVSFEPGQEVTGHGVFLGTWTPTDREGRSLSRTFNVFAAPEDLPVITTYDNTVNYIAQLKNWHGYDGTPYKNDKELYAALEQGIYDGGWIIPPRPLLAGTMPDAETNRGAIIQPDNLLDHRNKGAFENTFSSVESDPGWYWSSTQHKSRGNAIHCVRFSDRRGVFLLRNNTPSSCRPVRLVPK